MVNWSEPHNFHLKISNRFWNLKALNHSHASCKEEKEKMKKKKKHTLNSLFLVKKLKYWEPQMPC